MKKLLLLGIFWATTISLAKSQNLLNNSGFETFTAGYSGYITTGNGDATGLPGQWQLAFVGNNYPTCTGASCGTTQIDNTTQNSGSNSLKINITKQTNRNDIRLFQSIASIPSGNNFVVTFFMKSDIAGYPVTVNVFKSTEAINSNGAGTPASPYQSYTTSTRWLQYKMYVDLSTWTIAERNNMRISIRPNTTTALPTGAYPKNFWFDDISFKLIDSLTELKDIAIQVATNRKYLALDSGYTAEANLLQTDINTLIASTPAAPIIPTKAIGFNPAPTQTTALTNPFIAAINNWAATYLTQTFTEYPKATPTSFVFDNGVDGRSLGTITENLYWLLVSPYSSYRYNPELFRRFLTIVYATSDDYKMNGGNDIDATPGSTTNALNDWFAAPKACYSWRMADLSFTDYIPATLKQRFKDATDTLGKHFYNFAISNYTAAPNSGISINYTNRDISYAEILTHAGLYKNNSIWIAMSKRMVDSINLVNRYADGAYSYIEKQNETTNYHGGTNNSLAKIWAVSEYQPAWDCISKTAMYELVSPEPREVPEFYTAPAWKTQWNGSSGISAEPLLSITQNPYLKTRYNQYRVVDGYDDEMPLSLAFYNANITALPIVDNYVCYDRNIQGPRGRYNRFSYAATGRNVSVAGSNDPGLQTIIGAMETIAGRNANQDEMDAALMVVHSKVHIKKSSTPAEWTDWGYMLAKTNAKICVSRTASTISTDGVLQYQTSGPTGVETNWASYQQWITLPDRIIGVVETYPKNNVATQAFEIDGRVRFTYGRQSLLNPKYMITEQAGSKYSYGKFKTIIHAHDFTSVLVDTAGILRDDYRQAMEIIFRYNLSTGNTLFTYPANTKKYFIVEIRDSAAIGDATVSRIINGNIKGLIVKINGKSYASFRNDSAVAISQDISTAIIAGNTNQVHFSRTDTATKAPYVITGNTFSIPAKEQILIISTTNLADLGRGWDNFPQLFATNGNFPSASTIAVTAAQNNTQIKINWNTTLENNLATHTAEKSADSISFTTVNVAQTAQNTGTASYLVNDNSPIIGKNFYRIKTMSNNGFVSYSNVISANYSVVTAINNLSANKSSLIVYPNPIGKENCIAEYTHIGVRQAGKLIIFDASGKEVYTEKIIINNGINQFKLSLQTLKPNIYIIKITGTNVILATTKLIAGY